MQPTLAAGPLVVSASNPRYFAVRSEGGAERAVYLTGSHINNNLHDGMGPGLDCVKGEERFDFDAYLAVLVEHGHSFIRLWRWEQFKGRLAPVGVHFCMTPQPWPRTGPGKAKDGKPRFDLSTYDDAYFERLRERVIAAGNEGIYVSVMLFEGFSLHLTSAPDNIEGHPFHPANNVNGIGIGSIVDYQVLPLDPAIEALQEAYIHKVVDTVHDLPNVLYEVANEAAGGGSVDPAFAETLGLGEVPEWGDSTDWQYWVIETVKRYEADQGYEAHVIGMTMQFPVADQAKVNDPLYGGPADWISPGPTEADANPGDPNSPPPGWLVDPPVGDGRKVVLTDTDHYAPGRGDALWAWKSFLRGLNPILYDFGVMGFENPGAPPPETYEPARYAMGDSRAYADRMQLLETEPRGDLSSTGYALARPGEEYLVLQPSDGAEPFTVKLDAGEFSVEWYSVDSRETLEGEPVTIGRTTNARFAAPFGSAGPALLYLKRS